MAKTAQKTKTLGELKEKAENALQNPKLIEIVQGELVNKHGRVNLTAAHNTAFGFVYNETNDLKKAEELAVATRWLAMMKRDYPAEFDLEVMICGNCRYYYAGEKDNDSGHRFYPLMIPGGGW